MQTPPDNTDPPAARVVPYAAPDVPDPVPYLERMLRWRSAVGWSFPAAVVGSLLSLPLGVAGAALCLTAITLCYYHMTRAALAEVDVGYAVRQLVLAVLLTPALLAGVMIVPLLVQSDLLNWREAKDVG